MRSLIVSSLAVSVLLLAGTAVRGEGEDAAAAYEAGRKAEAAGDYRTALGEYGKVLDIDEEHEDAFERWEYCGKLADWQEALTGEPTAADLVRKGEVWLSAGRIEEEREAYLEAIAKDPNCSDAHGHLALSHYAGGGDLTTVIRETRKFMETSPYRDSLKRALADFGIYGELRLWKLALDPVLKEAGQARKAGDAKKAAGILEAASGTDLPDAYRTVLLTEAGKLRFGAGDDAGARASFEKAVGHSACSATIDARLGLASLDVKAGDLAAALGNLKAAVAEGSSACAMIGQQRDKAYQALFTSEDATTREAAELLADSERGDDPIRGEIRLACEKAAAEKKIVLLFWYGPYCPYVMAMEERLAHPGVAKILAEKFVVVRVDYGSHHRAMVLDAEYGNVFNAYGVPCFMVLNNEGRIREIQRDTDLMGAPHRCYDAEKIAEWLEKMVSEFGE
jgi:tetratricopeptide (TPR) repeat protein